MVHAEEIFPVILVLQCSEPGILGAIGAANGFVVHRAEIVDVSRIGQEGLHGAPEPVHPADIGFGVGWIAPNGGRDQVVRPIAIAERSTKQPSRSMSQSY